MEVLTHRIVELDDLVVQAGEQVSPIPKHHPMSALGTKDTDRLCSSNTGTAHVMDYIDKPIGWVSCDECFATFH